MNSPNRPDQMKCFYLSIVTVKDDLDIDALANTVAELTAPSRVTPVIPRQPGYETSQVLMTQGVDGKTLVGVDA